ncbi:MAG: M3 family oligoendopeptidase [Bacteroidota bacterium]|nr:M3 family oligoendopeptidase [Bacteroidota bacterium]
MNYTASLPTKKKRTFLSDILTINSWESIRPYFENLLNRSLNSLEDVENWLRDRSELEAVLEEDAAWRYIKMNIDTTDQNLADDFNFFISEIQPKIAPYDDKFNKKLIESTFVNQLEKDKYFIYLRALKKEIEIFREQNIPLFTQLNTEEQKFGSINALMTVELEGKEITLQQAAKYLKELDRDQREAAFEKITLRRAQDVDKLNQLYSELIKIRTTIAKNAGFENYRDYKFADLGRFDYSVNDCYDFHHSIKTQITPVLNQLDVQRKEALGVEKLRPWDTEVDITGKPALKPFENQEELVNKTIECFYKISPYFGERLEIMKQMGYLDLESKKGKAPGGFNYPLYEIGVPFIYMNAVGSLRDLITMIHEGGHAIHSFLSRDLELTAFKSVPSEVAELASMSMELISMDYWDVFFTDEEELKRAKREQLEKVLGTLPWIATIDKFQHWVYENPEHSMAERSKKWDEIYSEFNSSIVDWSGMEEVKANIWQKQLHLFEVPFYYIEYGFAQLGAIAVWRNFKINQQKALEQYSAALTLGYTKPIGEIYETAGIKFDFSDEYVKELADFVRKELSEL